MAGRRSGYVQVVLAIGGMAVTTIFGLRFLWWYAANWSRLRAPQADAFAGLGEIWGELKWTMLGFGIFGLGWLWGLATGLAIVLGAKATKDDGPAQRPGAPPVLE